MNNLIHSSNYKSKGKCRVCPYCCRLAASRHTGRVKWCVMDEGKNHRCRKMRFLPLLPVIILPAFLLVSSLTHRIDERQPQQQPLTQTPASIEVPETFDQEANELEENHLASDAQTSFAPPRDSFRRYSRQKRNWDDATSWETYQGNKTSDVIIWSAVSSQNGSPEDINTDDDNQLSPFMSKLLQSFNLTNTKLDLNEGVNAENAMNLPAINGDRSVWDIPGWTVWPVKRNRSINRQETTQETMNKLFPNLYALNRTTTEIKPSVTEETSNSTTEKSQQRMNKMDWKNTRSRKIFGAKSADEETVRAIQGEIMKSYMDPTADPCVDFYQYACGNWKYHNPIPKDKAVYDTFEILRESLDALLKDILEEPTEFDELEIQGEILKTDAILKARHLYKSCMNESMLMEKGVQPLLDLLKELGGWPVLENSWDSNNFDWLHLMARLRLYNNDILVGQWVAPDIKRSDEYVIQFDQTTLGLQTRDYYVEPFGIKYLHAYKTFIAEIATSLGASVDQADQDADSIVNFETQLAQIMSSPEERRNITAMYQRTNLDELCRMVPSIDWQRYLEIVLQRTVNKSEPVVVFGESYLHDLVSLLARTSNRTIANYVLWRFVRHRISNLDDRFESAKQKFFSVLFGREESPPRWKNCVGHVNTNMGMAVGSMFVQKYFDENSKNETLQLTREIMQSFKDILNETSWLDMETKKFAAEKADAMMLQIGYPDFILSSDHLNARYKELEINRDEYFTNTLNVLQFLAKVEMNLLGSTVNRSVWNAPPAFINAFYSRNKNQIMFPAGILQPPFYHRHFPPSLNFGGIGVVIGHEITHGFDDKGRLFDKDGSMHRWWGDQAIQIFNGKMQCLIDQYSRYTMKEVDANIDGTNTQGENIADNGGIKQAYKAYKNWLKQNAEVVDVLPNINVTSEKLFFLNFAQIWCGASRPEVTRSKLKNASHSPGKFRVIGTLSNFKEFAAAFGCQENSPMNPTKKCEVW